MAKDTVRYPDTLVEEIGELVDEGVFESKSEYHRFAAEFVLSLLRPERDPSTFSYTELRRELEMDERCRALLSEADADADADGDGGAPEAFLAATVAVRRHALRGEYEAATTAIEAAYDPLDREAILLEELLGVYRTDGPPARSRSTVPAHNGRDGAADE
jgi:Arc/MetJ-type ribon-helix-helix transcriptional regulator